MERNERDNPADVPLSPVRLNNGLSISRQLRVPAVDHLSAKPHLLHKTSLSLGGYIHASSFPPKIFPRDVFKCCLYSLHPSPLIVLVERTMTGKSGISCCELVVFLSFNKQSGDLNHVYGAHMSCQTCDLQAMGHFLQALGRSAPVSSINS